FDDAVNTVNSVLSAYVDKKQIEAQQMFPHHFDRYSTDGLEFNMYIGESISPNQGFHELMVKNLRLWQLLVMVELEREYNEVRKTLEKPLSVASLVLAYGTTLSIQYRMDEKNFDVEGAYNARYEIVKKRIDKAHIKGTDERITKPGKLVVVYSRDDEEREYLRYFKFLRSKGYLEDSDPELVQLEDLQGVSGLKAVRLGINYNAIGHGEELNMQAIINEIQTKDPKEDQLIQS
ncbi:MAG: GAF domain-containing protein, partial [Bacteroidia bacterium]|nr:GAF domain-containing protein [Bacteroidia bacterium]